MLVLFVNHTALVGGAEHSLLELFRNLPAQGVSCAAAVPAGALAEHLLEAGGRVSTLPLHALRRPRTPLGGIRSLAGVAADALRLRRLMRRLRPALVHANSAKAALPAALAARSLGIPCLWHCRDLAPPAAHLLLRLCTRVLAISETVVRALPQSPKVALVANGIDLERFDPARFSKEAARSALGFPPDAPLVILVADLVPWKRHALFLETAAHIRRKRPDVRFAIAGRDRGEHPELAGRLRVRTAELGLSGGMHWLGHCPDTAPLYAAADVLLHPASEEPFGRVVCEAMAMGCRVVVADRGGAAEIAEGCPEGARCVGRSDPAAFAEAVLERLDQPATGAGRSHVAARYDVRRTAAELARLFGTCAAETSSR